MAVPRYVSSYKDRHGKTRYRYRRGDLTVSFLGSPGDPAFEEKYQAILAGKIQRPEVRPKVKRKRDGVIYVIQGAVGTPVKIGFTACDMLARRRSILQTANVSVLRVIAQADGYMRHERMAHAMLAAERISGEWFAWSPRTQRFATALANGIDAALDELAHDSVAAGEPWRTLLRRRG